MNDLRVIFYICLILLFCVQIYWLIQIYKHHLFKKTYISFVLILLFINLACLLMLMGDITLNLNIVIYLSIVVILEYTITIYHFISDIKLFNRSISSYSIHESLNEISAGFCFYDEIGLPLLMNSLIESISYSLSGNTIYNGKDFWQMINSNQKINGIRVSSTTPTILLNDGRVFSFSNQVIHIEKETVYQLLANDVTDLYHISRQIEEDNQTLSSVNVRLQQYNKEVSRLVRDEEILRSKIHVHDNLGHCIIATKYLLANNESTIQKQEVIDMWRTNISLLNKENERRSQDDMVTVLRHAANAIGLELMIDGNCSKWNEENQKIVMLAIKECMTNAVQHAKAKVLKVKMIDKENIKLIYLCNDGLQPVSIEEGGGLTSLRKQVEKRNGNMIIKVNPKFTIEISLPD